jgi:putative CocE/NonD family hydrolase
MMSIPIHGVSKSVIGDVKDNEAFDDWWTPLTICYNTSEPQSDACHHPSTNWPTIQLAGWWDIFMEGQLSGFNGLRALSDPNTRDKHVLIMAALGHCSLVAGSIADDEGGQVAADLAYEYFTGVFAWPTRSRIGRYNLWVMGDFDTATVGNYWTSLDEFPRSTPVDYMFQTDGSLATIGMIPVQTGTVTYTYDPTDPAPMLGGNNLPGIGNVPGCGTHDQLARENRSDVALFDSEVLADDLAVVGNFQAKLFISTDVPDTDFVVTISDLSPGATKSMLVTFGAQRMRFRDAHRQTAPSESLVKDQIYQVDVNLATKAYIFPKGHRVRVSVASAADPYFNANRNTGTLEDESYLVANQVIHIAPEYPSRITMPMVQPEDIPENINFVKPAQALVV